MDVDLAAMLEVEGATMQHALPLVFCACGRLGHVSGGETSAKTHTHTHK